jgi:hypothetical protein
LQLFVRQRDPLNDQYPPLVDLEAAIGPASIML